jgi:hypothetical protein
MCYNYRKFESVRTNCSNDLQISNKSIHQPKPASLVSPTRDSILIMD